MNFRKRVILGSKARTEQFQPFEESIIDAILQKCHKIQLQIQNKTKKQLLSNIKVQELLSVLDKDSLLLSKKNPQYGRLMSLVCNIKTNYHHKIEEYPIAYNYVNQALQFQKLRNLNVIDHARTLLNKSVIVGRLANAYKIENSQNHEYTHQQSIELVKQALEIIKNRNNHNNKKDNDWSEEYKLGEIIIISFHNIATELAHLKNHKQAESLYKKAYGLSVRILGCRHTLTVHLKTILSSYKQRKTRKQVEISRQQDEKKMMGLKSKSKKPKKNIKNSNSIDATRNHKYYYKIYRHEQVQQEWANRQLSLSYKSVNTAQQIKKAYQTRKTGSNRLPELRRNVKEIILDDNKNSTRVPSYSVKPRVYTQVTQQKISGIKKQQIFDDQLCQNNIKQTDTIDGQKQGTNQSLAKEEEKSQHCQLI